MGGERTEGALASLSINLRQRSTLLWVLIRFGRRKPLGAFGAIVLAVVIVVAAIAPFAAPHDPYKTNLDHPFGSPGVKLDSGQRLLLGSDDFGRDILSRLMHGARLSLYVGFVSVGIGVTLGALMGIFSAYLGGTVDLLLQRVVDAFMAFPGLILALGIMAVLGPATKNVIFVLIILFIPGSSRVIRSEALKIKETVYVESARAIGSTNLRIIFRHVLPNCMAPYIVFATANLGLAIVVEAGLSFLGVGTPIDVPTWGSMLAGAARWLEFSPELLIFPSIAISLVVLGFNLLGDSLRDVLDPRLRGT